MRRFTLFKLLLLPLLASARFEKATEQLESTTFNGKTVPPPTILTGETIDSTIADGYWLVEFFSPYCSHCQAFAPTWQTMYEFYYTQEPVPQISTSGSNEDGLNSFTPYYDFHFAKVDCVASADACAAKKVPSFPCIRLYKGGEIVKEYIGAQTLKFMSNWVEETLETIRPGSRPLDGPELPKVGAKSADPVAANTPAQTATGTIAAGSKSTLTGTSMESLSTEVPNLLGKSTPLDAEAFQRQVTTTRDPWFIKFYSPGCHHCRAMAANWQAMARQMQNQLNIGEVNCDLERRLCRDAKIRGFPTMLFIQGGERIEYDGLRGLGDLISYANKALQVSQGIPDMSSAEFEVLEQTEEVIFLYFYDHATTSEDFLALNRLIMPLVGHAKLVKTNDTELASRFKISTWPRLLVSRDGKATQYPGLSPKDMRDQRRVLDWMQTVWLPIVPELTASNAREIMDNKLVVLGILSRERKSEFAVAKREIKNAALEWIEKQSQAFKLERQELRGAKQLRIEEAEDRNDQRALRAAKSIRINMDDIERKAVQFAWVDGVFWERWTRTTFGISVTQDGEKVIVNDENNKRYWDVTMTGNPIVPSRTSILETLPRILVSPPKISPKSTTTALGHVWWIIRGQLLSHPIVSAVMLTAMFAMFFLWSRRLLWRTSERAGYFRVGEKGGPMDGLLGGNSGAQQGKVD